MQLFTLLVVNCCKFTVHQAVTQGLSRVPLLCSMLVFTRHRFQIARIEFDFESK